MPIPLQNSWAEAITDNIISQINLPERDLLTPGCRLGCYKKFIKGFFYYPGKGSLPADLLKTITNCKPYLKIRVPFRIGVRVR